MDKVHCKCSLKHNVFIIKYLYYTYVIKMANGLFFLMSGVIRGHGIVCQKFSLVTKTAWTSIREPAREQHKLPVPARFTYSYLDASLISVFKHDPAFKPFCPSTAGMEELSLEQIKTASELEEDIDFERGWWSGSEQYCVREKKKP